MSKIKLPNFSSAEGSMTASESGIGSSSKHSVPTCKLLQSKGRLELCADDFLCGWIVDADATHIDIIVNETRHETHTLFSESACVDPLTGTQRRHFATSLAERLHDCDRVSVRLDGRDLAGSPVIMIASKLSEDTDRTDFRFRVETPSETIRARLCTMSGWLTLNPGARRVRLLINGRPQNALFTVRPDVVDHFEAAAAVGWEFTCDVAAWDDEKASVLRLACEVDGRVIAEQVIDFCLPPLSRSRLPLHLFMHVPKTAGTSLNSAINSRSDFRTHWLYHRGPYAIAAQTAALSPLAFHDLDLVGGHFCYGLHEHVDRSCSYVAMLREPLAFLKSYFFYRKDVQRFPPFRDLDIVAALDRRLDHYLDNCFVRCFTGISAERRVDAEALAEAIANMEHHFAFVGLVECMAESVTRLSALFGVPLIVGRENRTPSSIEASALDMEIFAERAAPYVCFDNQLYQHVQRLFWS